MTYSIVIASYNQQEYLPDAIESALDQTVPCEVIVVNDGSTDNSLAVARSYEPRIKVISQVNKGLPSARNTGIMNATGDYILFLDADDILLDKCVETMMKYDADIIAPSLKLFGLHDNSVILGDATIQDFKTANRIGYFSAIRRNKLLEIGGYSPRMVWGYEDLHIWFDLLSTGATLKVLQDVLVLYRTKAFSMLTTAQQHHQELMAQIYKDFPNI